MKLKKHRRKAARRRTRVPPDDKAWVHYCVQHAVDHFRLIRAG